MVWESRQGTPAAALGSSQLMSVKHENIYRGRKELHQGRLQAEELEAEAVVAR